MKSANSSTDDEGDLLELEVGDKVLFLDSQIRDKLWCSAFSLGEVLDADYMEDKIVLHFWSCKVRDQAERLAHGVSRMLPADKSWKQDTFSPVFVKTDKDGASVKHLHYRKGENLEPYTNEHDGSEFPATISGSMCLVLDGDFGIGSTQPSAAIKHVDDHINSFQLSAS